MVCKHLLVLIQISCYQPRLRGCPADTVSITVVLHSGSDACMAFAVACDSSDLQNL
jgi:hypothetical protein